MKKFSFPIFCAIVFGIAIYAATPTENTPISAMPITTNVQEQAYFPLIQKYPGRSTNDNFRATISTLFHGRAGETVTNLAVTNIYVSNIFATTIITTNLFATNLLILNTNNYFTNLFVTNLFTSNLYATTVFIDITNTYLTQTNFVINGTNVATVGDLLWTNISDVIQPTAGTSVLVSNLTSAESLTASASFFMPTGLSSNLVAGENDLSVYQVGSMLLQGSSTDPNDTVVNLNAGGTGQFLFIENGPSSGFTIFDGQPLWDASGLIILTPGLGDWRPTQRGETIFLKKSQNQNWQEVARFGGNTNSFGESLWHTNVGSASISPNLAGTKLYITPKGYIGMGTTNIFDGKDIGIFRNVAGDGGASVFINTGMADVWPSPTWYSEWWSKLAPNEAVMDMTSSGSGGTFDHVWTVSHNNPSGFFYYQMLSNSVPTLELAGEAGDITLRGQINFGFDLAHVLYRSGDYLVITNDSTTGGNGLQIQDGNGAYVRIGQNASLQTVFTSSDGTSVSMAALNLVPNADAGASLGGEGVCCWWQDLGLRGTEYISGFNSGTNYSRLKLTHDGTNGAITLDSQSSGDAGVPRPFNFTGSDVRVGNVPEGLNLFVSQPPKTTDFYFTNVWVNGLTAGVNTVYTVPSGMRFLPLTTQVSANTNGTTCQAMFVSSAVPYRLASTSTVGTNGTTLATGAFVLEGGEDFAIDTTGPLYRAVVSGAVFTNTVPIFSPRLLSVSATTNLLYKVPAGKTAVEFNVTGSPIGAFYINSSGSAVDIKWYLVPGASAISTNQIYVRSNVADGAATSVSLLKFLKEGEAIVLESSSATATQVVYTTVLER